ncbi:MAG: SdpI family protein [Chloroflexota bacterium]
MTTPTTGNDETARRPLWSWRVEWPHLLVLAAMFAAAAWAWPQATPPIPIHWDLHGQPNGYGGRFEGLLLVPLLASGVYLLLLLLPRIDPARANYESFAGPFRVIRLAITIALGAMQAFVISVALGSTENPGRWVPVGVGLLLIVIGNVMGKVRPNYFVGVRTPWTLASARSWEATNRLGGRVFVVGGVGLAIAGYLGNAPLLIALGIAAAASFVWLMWVSYREWRDDPDRIPATGTRPAH